MAIRVHIVSKQHDPELEEYVRRRIGLVVGRFDDRLGNVEIRIRDENANRGGIDKSCSIDAAMIPRGKLHVHALDQHAYAAVLKAIHRLEHVIAKAVDRGHRSLALRHAQGGLRHDNDRYGEAADSLTTEGMYDS